MDRTHMIQIYNSLTRKKEELKPITPGHIGMYSCGITVYDHLHIGHARMLTVFDTVQRYLRHRGYKVTYVRNITDIDDKIIRRAAENNEPIDVLTERFIKSMHEDCDALRMQRPDFEPRATQYVPQIIAMVQQLIDRNLAYIASSGDVMFAVSQFEGYGRLSGKKLEDLRSGARVEVNEAKRDPLDFVLWKSSKPGEPAWDSPWGSGRPGWHIECSAMSTSLLGNHFDLHGGGMDLIFPHHENEIAQSCGATGEIFVNTWMHNGFVNIDNEKMSKSIGNFFTVKSVLPTLRHPEVLRYFILASHYRGPINYSLDQLVQADAALGRLYTALRDLPMAPVPAHGEHTTRFHAAMDDDFNTPEAFAVLQSLTRDINTARAAGQERPAAVLGAELKALANVLGLGYLDPAEWFRRSAQVRTLAGSDGGDVEEAVPGGSLTDEEIHQRIEARNAARKAKNWAESDRVRDELAMLGVLLEDKPGGITTWRRK
jgi:cysteinyl-tRNA synthetase